MKEFNIEEQIYLIEVVADKTSKIDLRLVVKENASNNVLAKSEDGIDIRQINNGLLISSNPYKYNVVHIELSKDIIEDNSLTICCDGYTTIESECENVSFDIMNTDDTEKIVDNIDFRGKCNSLTIRASQYRMVFLTNIFASDEITIYSDRGNIHMDKVKSPYMYVDTDKGSIFLEDVILDMFRIGSVSGRIIVKNCIFNREKYPLTNRKEFINIEGSIDIENMNCQVIPTYYCKDNIFSNEVNNSKFNLQLPYVHASIIGEWGKITVK